MYFWWYKYMKNAPLYMCNVTLSVATTEAIADQTDSYLVYIQTSFALWVYPQTSLAIWYTYKVNLLSGIHKNSTCYLVYIQTSLVILVKTSHVMWYTCYLVHMLSGIHTNFTCYLGTNFTCYLDYMLSGIHAIWYTCKLHLLSGYTTKFHLLIWYT